MMTNDRMKRRTMTMVVMMRTMMTMTMTMVLGFAPIWPDPDVPSASCPTRTP